MTMPLDPNAQVEADTDETKAKQEAEQAAHDQVVADDEEKLAADEAQLAADEGGSPAPTPAPPSPAPGPVTPSPAPEPAPTATLYEFIGADPSLINRAMWVDSGLSDASGNALYTCSSDPALIDSTQWTEYDGPTQERNAGSVEEQAARGVTNHGHAV